MFALTCILAAFLIIASPVSSFPVHGVGSTQVILEEESNCEGTLQGDKREFVCGDPLLGYKEEPRRDSVVSLLTNYNPLGGFQPGAFIERFMDDELYLEKGERSLIYPDNDGWLMDDNGIPIWSTTTLEPGTLLDRFGGETGNYLTAADTPFAQRSLPPGSLFDKNYHVYKVIKPLTVPAGPIQPWFGQPGMGIQFYLGPAGGVDRLLRRKFIVEVNMTDA